MILVSNKVTLKGNKYYPFYPAQGEFRLIAAGPVLLVKQMSITRSFIRTYTTVQKPHDQEKLVLFVRLSVNCSNLQCVQVIFFSLRIQSFLEMSLKSEDEIC